MSKPETHVRINLSKCEYDVVKDVAKTLSWKIRRSPEDSESDIFWQDIPLTTDELSAFRAF